MILQINFCDDTPIYVQLRNQIVIAIGNGELKYGERLPSIRQIAEDIGSNPMTVNKAYAILKSEGFISIDRRHGAKVSLNFSDNTVFKRKLENELKLTATEASLRGVNEKEFLDLCKAIYKNLRFSSNETILEGV